jgi:formylglycine-generating enzyme required for sulfatase activity
MARATAELGELESMYRALRLLMFPIALCGPAQLHATLTIPTVEIGNPGNPDDTTGFGGVGYVYSIGKFEVTNAQYVEFLNAANPTGVNTLGLYSPLMSSNANGGILLDMGAPLGSRYSVKTGRGNNPVVLVTWYSALRFANWLHNGQGSGSTETGAYTLLGGSPIPSNAATISRNLGASWFLPSEDEWYKAAYHQNDGVTANYWSFPTSTNATAFSDQTPGGDAPDGTNVANFYKFEGGINGYDDGYAVTGAPGIDMMNTQNYLTNVGAYTLADSPYGTFDQAGNVAEWTEAVIDMTERSLRGGSWFRGTGDLVATYQGSELPHTGFYSWGFRVASIAVPEPQPWLLLGAVAGASGLSTLVRRCAKRCRRRPAIAD